MDWITNKIAISGYPSSKTDLTQVDAIVNVDKYTPYKTDVPCEHLPLLDGPGNDPAGVEAVVRRLDELTRRGTVLVHCASGVSRSPFVIALFFTWKYGLFFDDAVDLVARRRSRPLNIDPGLTAQTKDVLSLLDGAVAG